MLLALALLLACGVLAVFAPAIAEWLSPVDAVPLPIASAYGEDQHRGVAAFRAWRDAQARGEHTSAHYLAPIHAATDVTIPSGTSLRTFYGERHVWIEPGVTVEQWLHGQHVSVLPGSRLSGSVEADEVVTLHADVQFERLHGGEVRFGPPSTMAELPIPAAMYDRHRGDHPLPVQRGSLVLPSGCFVQDDVIVTGDLTIGAGSRVRGNVKAGGRLQLERGAVVEGNAVAEGDVMLGTNARVHGVVSSASDVYAAAHVRVGLPHRLSTLTGEHVRLSPGVAVHGTVWARTEGVLE